MEHGLDFGFKDLKDEEREVDVKIEEIEETICEVKEEIKDEKENLEMLEGLLKGFSEELETNTELKRGIEDMGNEFCQGSVLEESMSDLRDKLRGYVLTHSGDSSPDLERVKSQLAIYEQICELQKEGREAEAMEVIGKLSYYGDIPEELMPSTPQDCSVM